MSPRRTKAYTDPRITMVDELNCSVLTEYIMMAIPKLPNATPPIAAGAFLKLSTITQDTIVM